jgi:predicted DNA-binding transcriptional regulator YafY
MATLAPVRRKLAASFAPALRDRIAGLRRRILIGRSASPPVIGSLVPAEGPAIAALFSAFLELRLLAFRYRDAQGAASDRTAEPQLLLLNYPVWYMIGWDLGRGAVRSFRCDRIAAAEMLEASFRLRPAEVFREALAGIGAITP